MADDILDPAFQAGTKEYHRRKSREWYHRTKETRPDLIKERHIYVASRRVTNKGIFVEKFGSKCAHCAGSFPDCVFEFHHKDGVEKGRDPSKAFALSLKRIEEELAKCIMLCANCHRIEHDRLKYQDHAKRPKHGKLDREILAMGRPRGPSPLKGVPKPHHSEAMKQYWARRKQAKEAA